MSKRTLTMMAAALILAAMLTGCSKAPVEAVQSAENALKAVEAAGAAQYAPAELTAANEAMARLQAELAAQDGKMSLMRRYGTAAELAVAAQSAADNALAETNAAKGRARAAAVDHIAAATELLATVKPMLAAAPRGKGSEADLKILEADLAAVDGTLAEAQALVDSGDFIGADAKATAATQSINDVKGAMEAAAALKAQAAKR